jgi:hypothetical protein
LYREAIIFAWAVIAKWGFQALLVIITGGFIADIIGEYGARSEEKDY